MSVICFDEKACDLCGVCVAQCPFGSLSVEKNGIEVDESCRMCGVCVKLCPKQALSFSQKPIQDANDKQSWRDILVFAEQELGELHPIAYELVGEAHKLARVVDFKVCAVLVGAENTKENAKKLLDYGVSTVYYYEDIGFSGFKADCYADALADCISQMRPSSVLIGGTAIGRSLAPRLSTRFRTGLTADCTKLEMQKNTDLVQIRPAFGGNVMAKILITDARPQFATIRYRVMDKAPKIENPDGCVQAMAVPKDMVKSGIEVLCTELLPSTKAIEEEDVLVVAGRGMKNEEGVALAQKLAKALSARLCFTRPMAESGLGDNTLQIGLSGRTVRPKLIVTCGVSGAIQFTAGMSGSACIVAINEDPDALIFNIAHYCLVGDAFALIPQMIEALNTIKQEEE